MRMIWANGVAGLYATSITVTGVRPRSHVQSNPLSIICMSMLVRAQ